MADDKKLVVLFNPRNMRGVGEDSAPPMGLVMAAIKIYDRFNVVIIDQRVEKGWKRRLASLLKERPVCVGISSVTGKQIEEGLKVAGMAKDKGCPVVWGGIHASLLPEETIANELIDFVVEGDGETAFAELVDRLASRTSYKGIPGVWYKEGAKAISGGQRVFVDMNTLPPIPYHLVDMENYIKDSPYGKSAIIYSSRGCPQRCSFCSNPPFNKSRWRAFAPERVFEDIERIRRQFPGLKHFQFWDDNFFASISRAKKVAELLGRIRPKISWSVIGAHVSDLSRMDDTCLAYFRDNSLKEVLIGVESGSQKMLDLINKNFTLEQLFDINRRIRKYGIKATYSFVSGVPGEEDEDLKKTIDVMFKLKSENRDIVVGNVKPFICYPGTAIYKKALDDGFRPPNRLEDWSDFVWGNYLNLEMSSAPRHRKRFLTWLYYYTILMNPDYLFIRSRMFKVVSSVLRPIAQWRVRRLCFKFPVEAWLMSMVQRLIL